MKKIVVALAVLIFLWLPSSGVQTGASIDNEFRGVLLNELCRRRQPEWLAYASEHDLSCAMLPQCFLSGYFLVIDSKTALKLDRRGELLARSLLQRSKTQNDFRVAVRGRLEDDILSVHSLVRLP